MPLNAQSGLLRAIENGEVYPVGSELPVKVNVRIIAATNRDIIRESSTGGFRKELLYRINVLNLEIPPLRKRKADIPELADFFLKKSGFKRTLDKSAFNKLISHDWPGNVRELFNSLYRASVSTESLISEKDIIITSSSDEKKNHNTFKKSCYKFQKKLYYKST